MKNKILILCGKSACGKDSIMKELIANYNYNSIVSWTSRPMRDGETNGVEYNFCNKQEFETMIKNNELIEYRSYNTKLNGKDDVWYYGIKKTELNQNLQYVVILDLNGAMSFVNHYGKDNCKVIYIHSTDNTRTERAMSRGSFDKTEWDRRMEADKNDFDFCKRSLVVNDVVINENKSLKEISKEIINTIDRD